MYLLMKLKLPRGIRKFVNGYCMRNPLKRLENLLMNTRVKVD